MKRGRNERPSHGGVVGQPERSAGSGLDIITCSIVGTVNETSRTFSHRFLDIRKALNFLSLGPIRP